MGMCGEVGEVVDMMKKHIYQGKELDINDVIEEVRRYRDDVVFVYNHRYFETKTE